MSLHVRTSLLLAFLAVIPILYISACSYSSSDETGGFVSNADGDSELDELDLQTEQREQVSELEEFGEELEESIEQEQELGLAEDSNQEGEGFELEFAADDDLEQEEYEGLEEELAAGSDPYADAVVSVSYGDGAGFGRDRFPEVVLGAPASEDGNAGSMDVLSLGNCGSIVLEFVDNCLVDSAGDDLLVFENPFFVGGNEQNVFSETAVVDVSQDGENWHRFPFSYNADGANDFERFVGMAGLNPAGDGFDLSSVGLAWARFVRITDTGKGSCAIHDQNGNFIDDAGNDFPCTNSCGFDLDAIKAVNSAPVCPR